MKFLSRKFHNANALRSRGLEVARLVQIIIDYSTRFRVGYVMIGVYLCVSLYLRICPSIIKITAKVMDI